MAGIGGSHVRAATAFVRSARFVRYSPAARALWLHLQSLAVDMKTEFLPEEWDIDAIARDFGSTPEVVQAALDELTGATGKRRPIINTIEIDFGDGPVTLVRARGAREKQPVGWKDESDLARVWNETNEGDQVDTEQFAARAVNRRTEEGGSQPGTKSKVPQTRTKRKANATRSPTKRKANAPQTAGKVIADAARLPDIREEKRREQGHSRSKGSANAGDSSPPSPTGSATAADNGSTADGNGADPRLVKRFDTLTAPWRQSSESLAMRKRALMFLSADAPRVFSHVLEIDRNALKHKDEWSELTRRLMKIEPAKDEYHDAAKKLIRQVTT